MSLGRVVDHVYEQVWADFSRPTHPEDVSHLRWCIETIVSATVAYMDEHPARVDWTDSEESTCTSP